MKTVKIIFITFLLLISYTSYSVVHVINQSGFHFSPSTLTVNVGDVIRWVWSADSHTTTSKTIPVGAAAWDSPLSSSAPSFEYTVTLAGNYSYVCTPHESMGMVGSFTAVVPTAVDKNLLPKDFLIYPNPATSILNISTGLNGDIILSDILGKSLKRIKLSDLSYSTDSYQMDLTGLVDGIYIISFIPVNSKRRTSLKFIKE